MKKKFLSNLLLLVFLNLLIKPFWFFGIEVAVQNRVGEAMYGFYFSLFNFAFILNILLDFGITNFNNRAVSRDPSRLKTHLAGIVPLKFMLSVFYAIVVFTTGALIGYSEVQFRLLAILVLNQFLSSFILYLRSNISGLQLFRTDSLLSVLDRSLMILINGILLWSSITSTPYQIEWFVYSQTASYMITLGMVLGIVLYHSGKIRLEFKRAVYLRILRQSYPFAILILLMSFFNRIDSVMIERLLCDGQEQAGIYAQSFRVLDALSQFAVLFAALLLPMFSKMLKAQEKTEASEKTEAKTGEKALERIEERTEDLVRISSSLLLAVAVSVAVAGIFFNDEIIRLMYHETELNSPAIFSILMGGFVFISLSYIYGTLLTANRNLKQLNLLAGATVIINITLNLLLIPAYKAYGAAIASIASQAFYAIGQVVLAHRILRLDLGLSVYGRLLLYGVIVLGGGFALQHFLSWVPAILLFIAFSGITAILSGLVRPAEMRSIFWEE
ncbi:MAG: oligosaccharide flippase family protein [Bacteroidales bacterium]|nr:oligosaccharide flippase family protein [Bacteroidales bacterium]MDT8432698.1 oligosaccharide flippase family protein [Bacteroidales bacterium]